VELGANPISAQNAFLYDTAGTSGPYSSKNTTYTDSYTIGKTAVADFAAIATAMTTNKTPVGVVKANATANG